PAARDDRAGLVLVLAGVRLGAGQWHLPQDVLVRLAAPGERKVLVVRLAHPGRAAPRGPVGGQARPDEQERDCEREDCPSGVHAIPFAAAGRMVPGPVSPCGAAAASAGYKDTGHPPPGQRTTPCAASTASPSGKSSPWRSRW